MAQRKVLWMLKAHAAVPTDMRTLGSIVLWKLSMCVGIVRARASLDGGARVSARGKTFARRESCPTPVCCEYEVLEYTHTRVWPMAYGAPCGGIGRYARPA
eukprot:4109805-Prymnesium_polylepis.2